jgi:hypothetical protein
MTRRRTFAAAIFALLTVTIPAHAACHFNTPNAIVCTDADNAADVYQTFGFDIARTNESYNRELIREAGCTRPYGKAYSTVSIEQVSQGKIATPTGWVEVVQITVNDHDTWIVAKAYLDGICTKMLPKTLPGVPLEKH